ncbi:protein kinase [Nocardia sp. NPDC006044]|uniref:serine/threonine-protein kinase n=1 Tax=Nocardia sp. NPDC006044 TaxID=3364306 RepID=UPI0036B0D4BD
MGEVRFGGYRLERLLGRGGMGQVWLAYDDAGTRWVALKLLPSELAADAGYRKRFEREAEVVAKLRDPHIPRIHRFGEIDGRLFIDMEFVEGQDLASKVAAGKLAPAAAVGIVGQVAVALDVAHRAGLVHRDVKPSNIVVHASGFAYLIDFGIAHGIGQTAVTTTGLAIGTLAYMAPERFTGKADARADVYSLGCVLYECLTAARPYGDTDPAQQMHAHLMIDPPRAASHNAAVPAALDAVIARAMAKQPADRYSTAGDFAAAAHAAIDARPPDSPARPPKSPAPTKVMPEPGPTPTRVETRRAEPARPPGPLWGVPQSAPVPSRVETGGEKLAQSVGSGQGVPRSGPTGAGLEAGQAGAAQSSRRSGPTAASGGAGRMDGMQGVPQAGLMPDQGGRSGAARGAKPLAPTKVMPEPGPTPTRVETRLEGTFSPPASDIPPQPNSVAPAGAVEGHRVTGGAQGYPAVSQRPGGGSSGYVAPSTVAPQSVSVARQMGAAARGLRALGRPRSAPPKPGPVGPAAGSRLVQSRPGVPQQRYPVGYGRKVFPAPAKPPKYQRYSDARRPVAPVRRRRRKRGGVLSKVIGALVVMFLTPFMLAAGCVALLAGTRAGDSGGTGAPRPTAMAEENPVPPPDHPEAPGIPAAGTPVRDGKFEFVVSAVDTGVHRVGLQSATGSFVIVTLDVRNISDESKWFLPVGQRLFDAQGTPFEHNLTATLWQATQHGYSSSFELTPGQTTTTQLVFDVPPGTTPTHLELHDFVLSNGVSVRLD